METMSRSEHPLSAPEKLRADHDLSKFECGEPSLDDWLRRRALRNEETGAPRTYVVCADPHVVGYYALAVGAVAGTLLQQAALHVGPLKVSQPFLVIIDPIVSIALSVWLFAEYFTPNAAVLAVAAAAFAVMCAGVVLLTQTAPATMKA